MPFFTSSSAPVVEAAVEDVDADVDCKEPDEGQKGLSRDRRLQSPAGVHSELGNCPHR